MLSVFVTESVVRAVILKTTFVHCTTTLTHQQIPRMRSTDWLSHHRLAIYRYEYLGTNVFLVHMLLYLDNIIIVLRLTMTQNPAPAPDVGNSWYLTMARVVL